MIKKVLILMMVLTLVACSNEPAYKLDLNYDTVEDVEIANGGHAFTSLEIDGFSDFIETLNHLDYQVISEADIEDIVDRDTAYYELKIDFEVNSCYIYILDDKLILYYVHDDVEEYLFANQSQVQMIYDEFSSVEFPLETLLLKKPVIYLYPIEEMDILLSLEFDGEITTTYPKYNEGWSVRAKPNGKLTDASGRRYDYLYWEGITDYQDDFEDGFIVKKEDSISFLEDKLDVLGLTHREANDFISYWLPELEKKPYNKIRFLTHEYAEMVELNVFPKPDVEIRVFMIFEGLDQREVLTEQVLKTVERKGFTLVEWGGAEIIHD